MSERAEVLEQVLADHVMSGEPECLSPSMVWIWRCVCTPKYARAASVRSVALAGHRAHVASALDALAAQEGERGGAEVAAAVEELADYLVAMDRAGGGVYTVDFRSGFRHALSMLEAALEPTAEGHVSPMVREAARLALSRRADRIAGDQP